MAQIIQVFKDKVVKKYLIAPGSELTIGRHPSNKIVIDNLSASSKHAKIKHDDEGLLLTDLGSTNGTLVNNEKVSRCKLVHQDWVSIGNHMLIVDMYETLSLEATMEMVLSGTIGGREADQTVMFDMSSGHAHARLVYVDSERSGLDLLNNVVTIGKNRDADIVIKGFWSFLAGGPAAKIERRKGNYYLSHVGGTMKTKLNGNPVTAATLLNHQDIIQVGPVKVRVDLS
jgi:pSer/pThr/pTyr-binding forkhead associated (FHA) protein